MIVSINDRQLMKDETERYLDLMMELGCDAIQVVSTALERDGTVVYHNGRGNWYARRGATEYWLRQDGNRDLSEEISCSLGDDDGF